MQNRFDELREKVRKNIVSYDLINCKDIVLVGVSGGADSMALLDTLYFLKDEFDFSLIVLHLNHLLRGTEADGDEEYVREYCEKVNIPIVISRVDVKKEAEVRGLSIEEAARDVRYSFFYEQQKKFGAHKVAVAHNQNDQAETVLMNIIRGTGTDGLRGMRFIRKNTFSEDFEIIRPLLNIDRSKIEEYCEHIDIKPRVDSSNLETDYARNKVRINLMPLINKEFGCDITKNLLRLSSIVDDEVDYLQKISEETVNEIVVNSMEGEIFVNISEFNKIHNAIKKRVTRQILNKLRGNLKQVENINIENIINLSQNGKTGARINLPGGIIVLKSYKEIKFKLRDNELKNVYFEKILTVPGQVFLNEVGTFTCVIEKNYQVDNEKFKYNQMAYEQCFDLDKLISSEIIVRNRRDGDRIKPYGSNGTKKLKEYFIDEKIERQERDRIPLLAYNNEVIWIVGFLISDKYKVTERTKDILRVKFDKI